MTCNTSKPVDNFFPSHFGDGLTDNCKSCVFARANSDREQRERLLCTRALDPQRKRGGA